MGAQLRPNRCAASIEAGWSRHENSPVLVRCGMKLRHTLSELLRGGPSLSGVFFAFFAQNHEGGPNCFGDRIGA